MSLKAFHVIFITAAILLSFGLGVWMLRAYNEVGGRAELVYGIVAIGIGIGLVVYEAMFLKKLKNISYL
jgi:hypothetical protein